MLVVYSSMNSGNSVLANTHFLSIPGRFHSDNLVSFVCTSTRCEIMVATINHLESLLLGYTKGEDTQWQIIEFGGNFDNNINNWAGGDFTKFDCV